MPQELLFLAQLCTKSFVGWGFAPNPTGGAYRPRPLAVFRGLLLRGWAGGREGRGGERTEGGRRREERGEREFVHCLRKKKEKSAPLLQTTDQQSLAYTTVINTGHMTPWPTVLDSSASNVYGTPSAEFHWTSKR